MMFHLLLSCGDNLIQHLKEIHEKNGIVIVDAKNIFSKFTAEAISATTLGFKSNCIRDENNEVFQLALNIHADMNGFSGILKPMLMPFVPNFLKHFVRVFRQSTHNFFKKYVADEIARREAEKITTGSDVIQLLIQAKNGQLKNEDETKNEIVTDWSDDELITAQVFAFFATGFETTSSLMQMCSWELAMNQEIQKNLIG
jgi:cytochrome P450 family 6